MYDCLSAKLLTIETCDYTYILFMHVGLPKLNHKSAVIFHLNYFFPGICTDVTFTGFMKLIFQPFRAVYTLTFVGVYVCKRKSIHTFDIRMYAVTM